MHLAIDFSTWRPAPAVGTQPRVVLAHWRLFIGRGRRRFLVGMLSNEATHGSFRAYPVVTPTQSWCRRQAPRGPAQPSTRNRRSS